MCPANAAQPTNPADGNERSSAIHRTPRWSLRDRTPVTVHIVDHPDKIRAFLPLLADLTDQCLLVTDEVDIRGSDGPTRRSGTA